MTELAAIPMLRRPKLAAPGAGVAAAFTVYATLTIAASHAALAGEAEPQFNSFTGKYEMAGPGAEPQFNSFTGKYEMAAPGSSPQFNSFHREIRDGGAWLVAAVQ